MKVLNEYPGAHHYIEEWEPENGWYCPGCGQKGKCWTASSGDYYMGEETICTHCGNSFYIHGGPSPLKEANELGILNQLREQVTATPTTRRGG